jgi:hypothetical protein
MPSSTKKQQKLMAAVANSPKFAKKVGIPVSVGKKFAKEDKKNPPKFAAGGSVDRIGKAVTPSRRDPDIGKMIKEVPVLTKKRKK